MNDISIGAMQYNNGRFVGDYRDDMDIAPGEYDVTIREDDEHYTIIAVLPDGSIKEYVRPQIEHVNGSRMFMNLGGITLHSYETVLVGGGGTESSDDSKESENGKESNDQQSEVTADKIAVLETILKDLGSVDTDTPEARIANLEARRTTLQTEINGLMTQMGDTNTLIARQAALIAQADILEEEANTILQRWRQQEGMESEQVVPYIEMETFRLRPTFDISYRDFQEGYYLTMTERGSAFHYDIPTGTGSVTLDMPRFGWWGASTIELRDADGNLVQSLLRFNHTEASSPSKTGAGRYSKNCTDLAYVPEVPEALRVSDAQKAEADEQKADAIATRIAAEDEIERLEGIYAADEAAMHAKQREQIPYNRMHVTANNTWTDSGHRGRADFTVQYMSNLPQVFFAVKLQGEPGYIIRQTKEHPGGTSDGHARLDIRRWEGGRGHGKVEIFMYSDPEQTTLLDSFSGGYNRNTSTVSGQSSGTWGELETGRIVENPYEPTISAAHIIGPNVVVAIQSPYDASRVQFDGGGLFSQQVFEHEGGTELQAAKLTFNADQPTGNYTVWVYETVNNRRVAGITLHWDAATRQLSVAGENPTIVANSESDSSDIMRSMVSQMQKQEGVDSINLSEMAARRVQSAHIYQASSFNLGHLDDVVVRLQPADWFEGTREEVGLRKNVSPSEVDYHRSAINAELWKYVGAYEERLKDLLVEAMKVVVATWNGDSQSAAYNYFMERYTTITSLPFRATEGHLNYPDPMALLRDAHAIGNKITDAIVQDSKGDQKIYAQINNRMEMQNYSPDTDGNGIPDDQESRRTISRAAYEHNLGVLREVHGVGSLQVQSYVGWWEPDTENQDTLFTTKETNDLLNEILANQTLVAFAGVNDGGVRFATQIASQESTETLLAGDASLDRWWATAGENPIDTTWTATITREGNYYLRVLSEQWDFDSAVITNNGTLVDMQSGKTDYMHLSPGIYTFQFRGVGVPTTPTVEEVNFSLVNINGLDYTYSNDFDAMFIADRPEIDTNQQFNILTDNVCIVANGVQKLIETFAPNLHFSQGEDYAMPYSIDAYQIHTDGNANGEIDVNVAPSSSPTIYASVVQDGDRLAINYHFFYPKSNWHTKGGFNDHEGDWEGVTVFLNKDGEHWVKGGIALAQHTQLFSEGIETEHNDGGAYYDNWTGIGGTHPNVYVGLGGHASYLHPDTYDVIPATTYDEIAEGDGTVLWHDAVDAVFTPRVGSGESDILDALRFSGYWGAEDLEDEWIGDSAPQGPVFTSNGYEPGLRWMDPWEWGEKFK